uniref:Uncharacterized protein n=1 Tax=Anopheles darlingi TaxID=43151 RepID=A0A2M4D8C9_ANODA
MSLLLLLLLLVVMVGLIVVVLGRSVVLVVRKTDSAGAAGVDVVVKLEPEFPCQAFGSRPDNHSLKSSSLRSKIDCGDTVLEPSCCPRTPTTSVRRSSRRRIGVIAVVAALQTLGTTAGFRKKRTQRNTLVDRFTDEIILALLQLQLPSTVWSIGRNDSLYRFHSETRTQEDSGLLGVRSPHWHWLHTGTGS